jgi:hypothetical protein
MVGFGGQVCGFLLYFIGIYFILLLLIGLEGVLFFIFLILFFILEVIVTYLICCFVN